MTHAERSEQWRAIFKEAQAKQLEELPLSPLDSPLERAKHQIAFQFFRKQKLQTPQRLALWRADEATRRAFFDCFGFGRDDAFCLQNGLNELPPGPRNYGGPFYLYAYCAHIFSDLENSEVTRSWSWRVASRGGFGGADLWRFDGTELVFVQTVGGWIS